MSEKVVERAYSSAYASIMFPYSNAGLLLRPVDFTDILGSVRIDVFT